MSLSFGYALFQAQRPLTPQEQRQRDDSLGRLAAATSGWFDRLNPTGRGPEAVPGGETDAHAEEASPAREGETSCAEAAA